MNWEDPDRANAIKIFHQQCDLYFSVKNVAIGKQVDHVLLFTGATGIKLYNSWGLEGEDKKNPTVVWEKFETQLRPRANFRVARLYLQKYVQKERESADDYISRLKLQAYDCEFRDDTELQERIIEQFITGTRYPELQKDLLGKNKSLTLKQMLELSRTFEASQMHMAQLAQVQTHIQPASIDVVRRKTNTSNKCPNCGGNHARSPREACPAYGTKCNSCGKLNHWRSVCRSPAPSTQRSGRSPASSTQKWKQKAKYATPHRGGKQVQSIHSTSNIEAAAAVPLLNDAVDVLSFNRIIVSGISAVEVDDRDDLTIAYVEVRRDERTIMKLRSKVDSGAEGNTLPLRMFRGMYPGHLTKDGVPHPQSVHNSSARLFAYNETPVMHFGSVRLPCRFNNSTWLYATFYIVESRGPAIIGCDTGLKLKLLTLHTRINEIKHSAQISSTDDLVRQYPDQFDKIGNFPGEYHIVLDPDVQPVVHAPRRCPIHLRDELKREFDDMEGNGVITKVIEPSAWVSSIAVSRKSNGKLRVCLDPKDLNRAIRRCHYRTITTDEVIHKLSGARHFSKLDAKNGYWSIKLDHDSSLLTTFNSPFGRYRYLRMPFGLAMSQDVFQQRMDEILEGCPGTIGIADDIVVFGKSEAEHDQNLHHLMSKAVKYGLQFNSGKCSIKVNQISFFGMIYDADGVHPDPHKVEAIKSMSPPENKSQLREFLGMITYLSPFIPNLSAQTASLRGLLKQDAEFQWTPTHQSAFNDLRDKVCHDATRAYFDVNKPTVLQVDASLQGLGATLLQDEKGIAFASKALSDAETRYANIERELLAVVFGCERFHIFLYGKSFIVETDHKPLEMIQHKHLAAAPPRLQRMLLRLQPYKLTIVYKPGKDVPVADCLSRRPLGPPEHIHLDLQINFVQFAPDRLSQLKEETAKNAEFAALQTVIVKGWPEKRRELPRQLQRYWAFRDQLAVEDGLILNGERILIPHSMREYILSKLHEGHQGIEKTRLRAKASVYWESINDDIEVLVKGCSVCQEYKPSQPHETLLQHEIPTRSWQVLGTDLFHFEGNNYLIIADYFSKFPFIRKMPQECTSAAVVNATRQVFAEQGVPERIVSDNGRHFDSSTYRDFATQWGFSHVTSSPHYPRSNGFIERMIQTVKNTLKKAKVSGIDPNMALLCIRATPIDSRIPSPAELLYGRKMKDNLPTRIRNNSPGRDDVNHRMQLRQQSQKYHHDKSAHDLAPLSPGQLVRVQDQTSRHWITATVREQCHEPRSYLVETPNGRVLRRNRQHLADIEPRRIHHDEEVTKTPDPHTREEMTLDPTPDIRGSPAPTPAPNPVPIPNHQQTTRSGRVIKKPEKLTY
ncbi:uncharacterized protein K02A2.6-like [Strongylocentrotus purpuratus]|uniref:Reverse transcriptase n=1 Tax=Strongylocentrotus purpuratus TaxID=7668 RepID=A0A7M7LW05_STRPU|nr:uncharacterized protein K02A2.6-like [Strongylocentrotus purpuratus]|eukprot:XP_011670764.1 PREDICTED: uncharacterized protein K02A2.6-like [Strongylocentrotus purpuratus]